MSRAFTVVTAGDVEALGGDVPAAYVWARILWRSEWEGSWVATIATIAEETGMTVKSVRGAVARLRSLGWVIGERASGKDRTLRWTPNLVPDEAGPSAPSGYNLMPPRGTTSYQTVEDLETTPLPPTTVDAEQDEGDLVAFPGNGEPMTAQPSPADVPFAIDVPGLPSLPARRADDTAEAFTRFWEHYPRRVGKQAAQRAFEKAVKAGTEPAVILWGLRANEAALQAQHARGFCPHPTTWLNAGRWEDDPEAVAPRQTGRPDPMMDLVREGITRNGGLDAGSAAILNTLLPTPPRLALGDSA